MSGKKEIGHILISGTNSSGSSHEMKLILVIGLTLRIMMQRAHSLEKTLMLEKIEGRRRRGQQRMS